MRQRGFQIGDVLLVALPGSVPREPEQEGYRPAVVVGVPDGEVISSILITGF